MKSTHGTSMGVRMTTFHFQRDFGFEQCHEATFTEYRHCWAIVNIMPSEMSWGGGYDSPCLLESEIPKIYLGFHTWLINRITIFLSFYWLSRRWALTHTESKSFTLIRGQTDWENLCSNGIRGWFGPTGQSKWSFTCMPSWPEIPTPTSATWIMLTSLAPSPENNTVRKNHWFWNSQKHMDKLTVLVSCWTEFCGKDWGKGRRTSSWENWGNQSELGIVYGIANHIKLSQ
jgi:hypothetical protein